MTDDGDEDRTPVVILPAHRPLVMALHNHAAALASTRATVEELRDSIAAREQPLVATELAGLGKTFRADADAATEVARAAERLAEAK